MIGFIIAAGIVAFLFLYFSTIIEGEHVFLKLLTIFFFLSCILLIGKATIDEKNYCEVVVSNTTTPTANFTSYEYEYFCHQNEKNTAGIFYNGIIWYMRLFFLYLILYFIYLTFKKGGYVERYMK